MHPKLLTFRYKLFRYRAVERALVAGIGAGRLLDIGCGDGENLLRFAGLPARRVGLEVSGPRLRQARAHGLDVLQATGTRLPFPDAAFDMIYVAHVLHHVADYPAVLAEIRRCLAPGGVLFLVETVTDHPLLRLARRLYPVWRGDAVEADWRYADLVQILERAGFQVRQSGRYNLLFFLWEMFPLAFWPLEIFTPIFVYLDLLLAKFLSRYAVHCYFVAAVS
ncbi:MAG: class I SAM-dependent methyltransferase [Anaerolineales bacterium]|nr:class I SAM-dependent methyltransferase [Anaerolineales bacterium]MCB8951745.1 class I SAM-dependent methyltransferase [Ardenticatenales bacterium]